MSPDARGDTRRPLTLLATAAVLVSLAAAQGCVSRRAEVAWPLLPPSGAYSAAVSGSISAWGRGLPLSGVCAVDAARGLRVELRDPAGATRLLLLASPGRCTLVSPGQGLSAEWDRADASAPWGPGDLWLLFTGRLPAGVSHVRMGTRPTDLEARWNNGLGDLKGRFEASGEGPCPFRSAVVDGPGHARLSLSLSSVRPGAFPQEVFTEPPGDYRPSSARELLEALAP